MEAITVLFCFTAYCFRISIKVDAVLESSPVVGS